MERPKKNSVVWKVFSSYSPYVATLKSMERRVEAIAEGKLPETIWLVESEPVYTLGASAKEEDIHTASIIPIVRTGRGGKVTYHGPGQRVVYVMISLRRHGLHVHGYLRLLEAWIVETLGNLGVRAKTIEGKTGVWVRAPSLRHGDTQDRKIAFIGVQVRHGVTLHGLSLNVDPNLDAFDEIVPCGLSGGKITSLADLGATHDMACVDAAFKHCTPFG